MRYSKAVSYYEVRVASNRYHAPSPLTYSGSEGLDQGAVVVVELQRKLVTGIVLRTVDKPSFPTKTIHRVVSNAAVPRELIDLATWIESYYPAPSGIITQLFVPSALLTKGRPTKHLEKLSSMILPGPQQLSREQASALKSISQANGQPVLIHGDTGTGKTRLYIELAKQTLAKGRSCLVLTPEISLTPQLVRNFEEWFPGNVYIIHSNQTTTERRKSWLSIAEVTEPKIVIGPRSALFSPLHSVGLIVIDEMHDDAYKQEQLPRYQTTRVAGKLAQLHAAQLIMGSATPGIADYYAFTEKNRSIVRLTTPANGNIGNTTVSVVDLNNRDSMTRSRNLSDQLIAAIQDCLNKKTQALIFLNRRGTARVMLCKDCGWKASCPKCDLQLTYHNDAHRLRCHTCGHTEPTPTQCPTCGSVDILLKSFGTKALVTELHSLFPNARIQRFDSDSTKYERLEHHFEAVVRGDIDILVGTQMLSKGLDLPRLSLVGVVSADTGLHFPDYTAEEKTFQMISQVIGRVGRGHQLSTVIIQTYLPDNRTLNASILKDYAAFYANEIQEREAYAFPPFFYMAKLSCTRKTSASAQRAASILANELRLKNSTVEVIGPSPAFTEKVSNAYRWQVIVKAKNRNLLLEIICTLPANWDYDLDPSNLL